MSNDYKTDRQWSDAYDNQVLSILTELMPYLVVLSVASDEADTKHATDFEVNLLGGTIAVRLRRMKDCPYRDLTIRSHRDNGAKTELAKVKEGHGFRYFYGWIDDSDVIAEWMLIDLDKIRSSDLLEKPRREISNHDGTWFIAIPSKELFNADCVIAYRLPNKIKPFIARKPANAKYTDHFIVQPIQPSLLEVS